MKILFLNLWHGKLEESLKKFLNEQQDVDVFCFQEASDASRALPEFLSEYQQHIARRHVAELVGYSQATYVHPRWQIKSTRELMESDELGLTLGLTLKQAGTTMTILNVHGTSRAFRDGVWQENDDKQDFSARIEQSQAILECTQSQNHPVIIGGDFNILPDTESLEIFRRAGYRDLIREYHIDTTRNHHSWDKHPQKFLFSDYCFVSPELSVKSFEVPNVEVSDHLPMILEIEL